MNYALDALWWKLKHPSVRDLASLLTAPPLWVSNHELPVRELLGESGFRYLLDLDQNPQPLANYLAQYAPFHHRLGVYAEHLLAFWLSHAPHAKLLAYNLNVLSDSITIGSADFIVSLNNIHYHIELTCKYYCSEDGSLETMCGLNSKDLMTQKVSKLTQQLMLLRFSDGIQILEKHHLPLDIKPVSMIRGIGFFPENLATFEPPIYPYAWRGLYIKDWADFQPHETARYCVIERMNYLAPARVHEAETLLHEALSSIQHAQVAELALRPDGYWHEIRRIMKVGA